MKERSVWLGVLMLGLVMLSACGKDKDDQTAQGPPAPPPKTMGFDCSTMPIESNEWVTVFRAQTGTTVYLVDIDKIPKPNHPAICLSESKDDLVLWTGSDPHHKKLKFPTVTPTSGCAGSPFVGSAPTDLRHTHASGKLSHDSSLVGCSYDLKFKREDNSETDPHIKVGT
jgi:hypothetical protein